MNPFDLFNEHLKQQQRRAHMQGGLLGQGLYGAIGGAPQQYAEPQAVPYPTEPEPQPNKLLLLEDEL